jgi:catechol 2,3-dioxygenase-like lactoylglutathione lyase family enzyme
MRRGILFLWAIAMLAPIGAWAQPVPPNEEGITMGHWHLNTADVAASKRLFVTLGGLAMRVDDTDVVRFRGVDVYLHPHAPSGGTVGTVVNHIGFIVPNLAEAEARWKAAGLPIDPGSNGRTDQRWMMTPDQARIEFLEDATQTDPIKHHHVHIFVPAPDIPKVQAWYAEHFGAVPGMRANFQAADIPGANLTFGTAATPALKTPGTALDRIAFRVEELEAFTKKLEAAGVALDKPYAKNPRTGSGSAFLYDPWGTYIELTDMIGP